MATIAQLRKERDKLLKKNKIIKDKEAKLRKMEAEEFRLKKQIKQLKTENNKTKRKIRAGAATVKRVSGKAGKAAAKFFKDPRTRKAAKATFNFLFTGPTLSELESRQKKTTKKRKK